MDLALPWVEKYRPQTIDHVVGQTSHSSRFKIIIKDHTFPFPNVIMVGRPGTGKTTMATCVAREYLKENFNHAFMEINGSDDRSSKVMSEMLVPFCTKCLFLPPHTFRIALIDEIDSMISSAQQTLKCIMEEHSKKVRFFLVANVESKLIRELYSQCVVLRFSATDRRSLRIFLEEICDAEQVEYTKEGLETLVDFAEGDIRRAVNDLQAMTTACGNVTTDHVQQMCSFPPEESMQRWYDAKNSADAITILEEISERGYSASDIYHSMIRISKKNEMNAVWLMQVGEMIHRPHTFLQLAALTCSIKSVSCI